MNIHKLLITAIIILSTIYLPTSCKVKPTTKPNIIVVIADQFRSMDMGCYGSEQVKTPNFDRLAKEGARFTHAVSTYPVCSPYRGMLLTGNYPFKNGMVVNDFYLKNPTPYFAEVCKAEGYQTGYIGKWHIDGISGRENPIPKERWRGFDYWRVYGVSHDYFNSPCYYQEETTPRIWEGYDAIAQTDALCEYINQSSKTAPFCMFLSWGPPHGPYIAPQEYMDRFDKSKIKLRPNVYDFDRAQEMYMECNTDMSDKDKRSRDNTMSFMLDTANVEIRKWTKGYFAAIETLDDQIGRILRTLEKNGQLDNTIIVFTSDHGDNLGSHRMREKDLPFEESISIPFLVRYPGKIKAGKITDALLAPVDVMPTLFSLAGISCPKVDGNDISGAACGKDANINDAVLLMRTQWGGSVYPTSGVGPYRGVRTKRYTYVRKSDTKKPWLLFDNEEDPYQYKNLVDDPTHAELVKKLDKKTSELLIKASDPEDPEMVAKIVGDDLEKNGRGRTRYGMVPKYVEPGSSFKQYIH